MKNKKKIARDTVKRRARAEAEDACEGFPLLPPEQQPKVAGLIKLAWEQTCDNIEVDGTSIWAAFPFLIERFNDDAEVGIDSAEFETRFDSDLQEDTTPTRFIRPSVSSSSSKSPRSYNSSNSHEVHPSSNSKNQIERLADKVTNCKNCGGLGMAERANGMVAGCQVCGVSNLSPAQWASVKNAMYYSRPEHRLEKLKKEVEEARLEAELAALKKVRN